MNGRETAFSSILFTLKKSEEGITKDDSEYYKYRMAGYYNGLDIHTVSRWYDLRPRGLTERKLQIDLELPFTDIYTIRTIVPENADALQEEGFCYDFWRESGKGSMEETEREFPFLHMSVLNFTESFISGKQNLDDMLNSVKEMLKQSAEDLSFELPQLHCAFFPSAGYADLVILFLAEDEDKPRAVMKKINESEAVSDCYSVCGVSKFCGTLPKVIDDKPGKLTRADLDSYRMLFGNFMNGYEEELRRYQLHIRSSRTMHRLMRTFLSAAGLPHGFAVREILGSFFSCFIESMEYIMSLENGMELREDIIASFNAEISAFLDDMIRRGTHFAVGNETKLLASYSVILKKLTACEKKSDEFVFIVSSGGCDKTEVTDIFFASGCGSAVSKPIIITIPEASLYDVQGTLFRILHEYSHFIGDRKRRERYRYIVNALAGYFAWEICEIEFSEEDVPEVNYTKLKDKVTGYLTEDMKTSVESKLRSINREVRKQTEAEICTVIKENAWYRDCSSDDESVFYAEALRQETLSIESFCYIFREGGCGNNLRNEIYQILYNSDRRLKNKVIDMLSEYIQTETDAVRKLRLERARDSVEYLLWDYKFHDAVDMKKKKAVGVRDSHILGFLDRYFSSLARNHILDSRAEQYSEYESCHTEARNAFGGIRDDIIQAMVESFSDCRAIHMLAMRVEDFLLAFIYEVWDVDAAFPFTLEDILRIGSDLSFCYGISGGLSDEVKTGVRDKVRLRKEQGYEYHNVEEMLRKVDEILECYQEPETAVIGCELESYLKLCFRDHSNVYCQELIDFYNRSGMDNKGSEYEVVNDIFGLWKSLGVQAR